MKKIVTCLIAASFLIGLNGVKAQNATNDLDQLKLAQKYLIGTWQEVTSNDTVNIWEIKQDGNVLVETDYIIVNGKKSIASYWTYNYNTERNNFYMFAAYVNGGYRTLIGSFIAENKWCQEYFTLFNSEKYLGKAEFVFDTPTSYTVTGFNPEGTKVGEAKYSKVK